MSDYSSNIVHNTAKILTLTKEIKNKLDGYPENKAKRPDIAYELLTMLVLADQLLEYADPTKESGEFFGLPKEAVLFAKKPLEFQSELGYDFLPWFGEKSSLLKKFVLYLYNYWESDPEKVELIANAPMTPMEWVSDGIYSSLNNIKAYAEKIFTMFCENKVSATKQL